MEQHGACYCVILSHARSRAGSREIDEVVGGLRRNEIRGAHQGRRRFSGGGGGSPATGSVFCSRILVIDNRDEKRGERDGVSLASRW